MKDARTDDEKPSSEPRQLQARFDEMIAWDRASRDDHCVSHCCSGVRSLIDM